MLVVSFCSLLSAKAISLFACCVCAIFCCLSPRAQGNPNCIRLHFKFYKRQELIFSLHFSFIQPSHVCVCVWRVFLLACVQKVKFLVILSNGTSFFMYSRSSAVCHRNITYTTFFDSCAIFLFYFSSYYHSSSHSFLLVFLHTKWKQEHSSYSLFWLFDLSRCCCFFFLFYLLSIGGHVCIYLCFSNRIGFVPKSSSFWMENPLKINGMFCWFKSIMNGIELPLFVGF